MSDFVEDTGSCSGEYSGLSNSVIGFAEMIIVASQPVRGRGKADDREFQAVYELFIHSAFRIHFMAFIDDDLVELFE